MATRRSGERVCVIGENVPQTAFRRPHRCGWRREIHLNGIPFTVIGVSPDKKQNSSYNGLDEDKIWLPYRFHGAGCAAGKNYIAGISDRNHLSAGLAPVRRRRSDQVRTFSDAFTVSTRPTPARSACGTPSKNAKLVDGIFDSMTALPRLHRAW